MQFEYFAYGLHIRADFALWPWGSEDVGGRPADVTVRWANAHESLPEVAFRPGLQDAVLRWPTVGEFWIQNGRAICVRPAPGATSDELALIAGGPALALLLEQRGCLVLHGSCVEIAGQATAFLGQSGAGKSTIAATLRDRGYPLISDGMTVLDISGARPLALRGPPHLKLWPDAIRSLNDDELESIPVVRQEAKRWVKASTLPSEDSVPLRRVFLLGKDGAVGREPLAGAAGLMGLVRNYFLADYADATASAFILERCARALGSIAVETLARGHGLANLPDLISQILSVSSS